MASRKHRRTTYLPLLQDTQSYLKSLLEQNAPDSVLVVAWEEFYRVYDDLIRRFVISQGVPQSDIDDCVQEVWGEVVVRLVEFERPPDRPGLRSWLYTLVRRKAANLFRHKSRRPAESLEHAKLAGREPSEPPADPAALCDKQWESALLESVLDELRKQVSDTNYRILRMRMIEERDVKEVARELNLTPEQVRYRHHRVMRKLQTYVALFTGEPIGWTNS